MCVSSHYLQCPRPLRQNARKQEQHRQSYETGTKIDPKPWLASQVPLHPLRTRFRPQKLPKMHRKSFQMRSQRQFEALVLEARGPKLVPEARGTFQSGPRALRGRPRTGQGICRTPLRIRPFLSPPIQAFVHIVADIYIYIYIYIY